MCPPAETLRCKEDLPRRIQMNEPKQAFPYLEQLFIDLLEDSVSFEAF